LTSIQFRGVVALFVVAGVVLGCLGFASLIVVRNYTAARILIDPAASSPLLKNPADANLANLQAITFKSHGLHLAGWYVPAKNRAAVVVTHGVHSDRASMLPEIRLLAAAGFGVLAFDWPGCGESEGPAGWDAPAKDALRAALDWLAAAPDVDPRRIGGLGFSIGGFILTQVAAKDHRVRAVVIESAATEFDTYITIHHSKWGFLSNWPARWAVRNSGLFAPDNSALRHIGEISPRPVFVIGQTSDPNVPESMIRELERAARAPKELWLISGSQHGSFERAAGMEYARRLDKFFEDNLLQSGTESTLKGN
jgi:dipeptidyl aminopeptidase/acylaminoacyl peptidase